MKIRVFLADDHAVLRDGLWALLESNHDIEVVGDAGNGRDAIAAIERLRPDVALFDISMPQLDGVQAAEIIHERYPATRIIMLSVASDPENIYRALRAGASGYLVKASAGREVVQAVRAVHAGKRFLSDQITQAMVEGYAGDKQVRSPLASLSQRERQVLQLLAEGRTAAEIGKLISLSPRTVETYRTRLMEKLQIKDLRALIVFAMTHGIISGK